MKKNEIYQGYELKLVTDGFVSMLPKISGMIAQVLVTNSKKTSIYAFAVSMFSSFSNSKKDDFKYLEECFRVIKEEIDTDNINLDLKTYEYHHNNFLEVQNPTWWKN